MRINLLLNGSSVDTNMNLKPKMDGILLSNLRAQRSKALRLVKGLPKWNDEKVLTEKQIDTYIEKLKKDAPNDPKVASILLKWLELKKKYQMPDANTVFKLDMEKLMEYALSPSESGQISTQKAICQTTKK